MKKQKKFTYFVILSFGKVLSTPPPPPPLPANLASQSVEQLFKLFSSDGGGESSFFSTLFSTTKKLDSLLRQSFSASGSMGVSSQSSTTLNNSILSSVPSSKDGTMTSSDARDALEKGKGSSSLVYSIIQNPNIPPAQKALLLSNRTTNVDGSPKKVTAHNKFQAAPVAQALSKNFASSFTGSNNTKLPTLVFNDKNVTDAYMDFVNALSSCPSFLSMFKKIHILALYQIYQYLVSILVTFNLISINDQKTYITLENRFGLNKKTLILGHLVELIEAQLRQTIQGIMQGVPDQVAIMSGVSSLQNQGANNFNMFILDLEKSVGALLDMDPLTEDQVATVISLLTNSENATRIRTNPGINQSDYEAALKIMSPSNTGFVHQLSLDQVEALTEAINTLTLGSRRARSLQDIESITLALQNPKDLFQLSSSAVTTFEGYVKQIAYGVPLPSVLATTKLLSDKLLNVSKTPFTDDEILHLKSVLAYLANLMEKQIITLLTKGIIFMGKSSPENMQLTISQSIALKNIVISLKQSEDPTRISQLNTTDLGLLSASMTVFSSMGNPPAGLTDYVSTYSLWATSIVTDVIATTSMIKENPKPYNALIDYLQTFSFSPTSLDQAQSKFSPEDEREVFNAFQAMKEPGFNSFDKFDQSTQKNMMKAFQELDAILETRSLLESKDAALLKGIFGNNPDTASALLSGLSPNDYDAIISLYDYINSLKGPFSAATLSQAFGSVTNNPYQRLQNIFTIHPAGYETVKVAAIAPGTSTTQKEEALSTQQMSFMDFLNTTTQQTNLSIIQQFIPSLSADQMHFYKDLSSQIEVMGINFKSLTDVQRQWLLSFFSPLQQAMTETYSKNRDNEDPNIKLLKNVAALTYGTAQYDSIKINYLFCLKQYLRFFNAYTASLSKGSQTQYQFISDFINQAKNIVKIVANSPFQSLNPPLFFYDENSMRSLAMLPQLSKLVENTTYVPYPTFCVEQVLNGSTINPYDGKSYENSVVIGQGVFSYNRFFFLDSTQQSKSSLQQTVIPELTGENAKKIPWLKKIPVPVSDATIPTSSGKNIKNYDHIYVAENKPNDKSGFYMNIPTFDTDPVDSTKVLIRLFEQEIIAQPEWLNYSGLTTDSQGKIIPGVMTMVRGCMGDFFSLVDLNIFDPILSYIFSLAMQTTQGKQPTEGSAVNLTALAEQCSNLLQEKSLDEQRMAEVAGTTQTSHSALSSNQNGGVLNASR